MASNLTIDDYQEKIKKIKEKLDKLEATKARHKKTISNKNKALKKLGFTEIVTQDNLNRLRERYNNQNDIFWLLCDIDNKYDEINSTIKKINEQKRIIQKYVDEMVFLNNKIELYQRYNVGAIREFLDNWESTTKEWYVNRFKQYQKLINQMKSIDIIKEHDKYMELRDIANKSFPLQIHDAYYITDDDKRNKYFDNIIRKEKLRKLFDLIDRVTKFTGEIIDSSYLKIGDDTNLNGVIIGKLGKAHVETIGAGGYNIQCFHYRVLVKKIS